MAYRAGLTRLTFLMTTLLAAGCDCSGTAVSPCDQPDAPEACGDVCAGSDPCPAGFYCNDDNSCTTDCLDDSYCSGGTCQADGRCTEPSTDMDATVRQDARDPFVCADVNVRASRVTPNVIMIIDQSSSMTASFGGSNRWDALRDSLISEPDGFMYALDSQVRFGVALYSAEAPGSSSDPVPGECPIVTWVDPSLNNYSTIQPLYAGEEVIDETPTGAAINDVLDRLESSPDPSSDPTIFILATDGEPDTCEQPNPQDGQAEAIAAVERAYAAGIRTFIISVGSEISTGHLQDMASAGVGGDPNADFYVAGDDELLRQQLQEIIGGQLSCVVTLEGAIQDLAQACQGTVRLNGVAIDCDDADGWHAVDKTHIELTGDACDLLQSTPDATLEATFPCDVILI